jgi:N-acyl-D-aspartate/D-glutamate deacylase
MLDTLIKGGTIVDGTGAEPFIADVGLRDGKIVALGQLNELAHHVIDAAGLHVMPGFVDIHTHYDGQASWDESFTPSIYHGVTTLVMGNCGVGFAPVRPGQQARLIDLMEGVEEIPETVLSDGIKWDWETFGEYCRSLDRMPHSLDFMTLVPHDCLRMYVMGERAERGEPATAQDLAQMQALLREALLDGSAGLAMGSTETHRTSGGKMTPSFEVSPHELNGLAGVLKDLPYRVLQTISDFASPRGAPEEEQARFQREYQKIEDVARVSGRPVSVTWMDRVIAPRQMGWLGEASLASAEKGITVRLQCAPRGIGVLNGLDTTMNLLLAFPGYREIAHLPPAERAARLRDPVLRERILTEDPVPLSVEGSSVPPLADFVIQNFAQISFTMYPYREVNGNVDYEPEPALSMGAQAKALGVSPKQVMYDYLAEGDGTNLIYFPIHNYLRGNFDTVREMLLHPNALYSLGDGGAHVGTICDASSPTTMLAHWAVQRTRGPKLPLPLVVQMLSQRNAHHMGLHDRGEIKVGLKADLNIVDLQGLKLPMPEIVRDLPSGARRVVQKSKGYVATFVSGQAVVENGTITSARPGRWTRAAGL